MWYYVKGIIGIMQDIDIAKGEHIPPLLSGCVSTGQSSLIPFPQSQKTYPSCQLFFLWNFWILISELY